MSLFDPLPRASHRRGFGVAALATLLTGVFVLPFFGQHSFERSPQPLARARVGTAIGEGKDPIVGPYLATWDSFGGTSFAPNGTITTSALQQGEWRVCGARRHLYCVRIGPRRYTVRWAHGVGIVDALTGLIYFRPRSSISGRNG